MTTNNNNYSVKELVAKYRNYVFENAPKEILFKNNPKLRKEVLASWEDRYPDYQLIGTLYTTVYGIPQKEENGLTKYISHYYKEALTEEEFAFLCNNYTDAINEIFTNGVYWGGIYWGNPKTDYVFFSNSKRLELVKEYLQPKEGSFIYIGSHCDIAEMYPNNTYIFERSGLEWEDQTLAKIWLSSKKINPIFSYDQKVFVDSSENLLQAEQKYNYIVCGSNVNDIAYYKPSSLYDNLLPKGRMLFFTTYEDMAKQDDVFTKFRETLVKDKAIASIVAFLNPSIKSVHKRGLMLVIEKSKHENVVIKSLNNNQTNCISYEMLNSELLWPSYYLTSLPSTGKPLSNIISVAHFSNIKREDTHQDEIDSGKYDYRTNDLDEQGWPKEWKKMSIIKFKNLVKSYKDCILSTSTLDKDYYEFIYDKKMNVYSGKCIFLFGLDDLRIGYFSSTPDEGIALDSIFPIVCLTPKEGIDIRYVVALLFSPEVKSQILSICNGEVSSHTLPFVLDKIIIPDHNEKERLRFLAEANYDAMLDSQKELKKNNEDYKKGVRMRKHAISQSMSAIESMFKVLNTYRKRQQGTISNGDRISRIKEITVNDAFKFMEDSFRDIMPAIEHLADVEYSFGSAEDLDPEKFIDSYISLHKTGWTNFTVVKDMTNDHRESLKSVKRHTEKEDIYLIPMMHFPKKALNIIFNNIISNAQSHGFIDGTRSDYQIRISWHYDGMNMVIELANNGLPLPADRAVSTLFEYGVSTALHKDGHYGIGCHEIDDIMRRFDGSVKLISSPDEEYTVKYVLTIPSNMVLLEDMTIADYEKNNHKPKI